MTKNFKLLIKLICLLNLSTGFSFSQGDISKLFPKFEEFKNQNFKLDDFESWYKERVNDSLFSYQIEDETSDEFGYNHIRINQFYNGTKIENAVYILHVKNNKIESVNGYFYCSKPKMNNSKKQFSKKSSFNQKKKDFEIKYIQNSDSNLVLCYEIDEFNLKNKSKERIYRNFQTGEIERKFILNHYISTPTIIETKLSGKQSITTDYTNGVYTLLDSTRGRGIETLTIGNKTNIADAKSIVDSSNTWVKFKNSIEKSALDVHYGATATYDYFLKQHKRNSIDNKGFRLTNIVNYGQNFVNAYWDGSKMIFGDGDDIIGTLVSLDIIGHEITHGLTANTAKLLLENESGALNESFSDIFGVIIDFYSRPDKANWSVAEEVSPHIRSLENPSINNDPDTYYGQNWKPLGGADLGGIHSNNGVQNHWFYLLVNGGNGINDNKDTFKIEGIGITKAAEIVYRNLVYYLTPQSNFNDARLGSIKAAEDIFGGCSKEVENVTNAWYAVGIGTTYQTKIKSQFDISYSTGCDSLTVKFYNKSQNAKQYLWDFGDGTKSEEYEPTHNYNTKGFHSVKLVIKGDTVCGIKDSITKINLINILKSNNNEQSNSLTTCYLPYKYTPAILLDTLSTLKWYDANQKQVNIGLNYSFQKKEDSVIYFEKNHYLVGNSNSSQSTAFYNYNVRHLIFDVYQPLSIESVEVFANVTGNRIFELRNNSGVVLSSKTISVPAGISRVSLNFKIDPGIDYQLGIGGNLIGLSRSNSGIKYPYEIPNLISIKRSNAQNAGYDFYYFFYNWDVKKLVCENLRYKTTIKFQPPKFDTLKIELTKNQFKTNADTNNYSFKWYDCISKSILENEKNTVFTPNNDGKYSLIIKEKDCEVKDTFPCFNFSTLSFEKNDIIDFEIHPNPSYEKIKILWQTDFPQNLEFELSGTDGKTIIRKELTNDFIDVSILNSGIYFIKLFNNQHKMITSKKLIKL